MTRWLKTMVVVAIVAGVAAAFLAGRGSAPKHDPAWEDASDRGYDLGLRVGRELQIGDTVGPKDKDVATHAFEAGYRAAEGDAFGNYDGGWQIGAPYVVILGAGTGGDVYRVAYREPMEKGKSYTLCSTGVGVCAR
jgi:hypothetical protein